MARDVFAITITAVGTEQMFSIGCGVCWYERNRLVADTIKMIMVSKLFNASVYRFQIDQDLEENRRQGIEPESIQDFEMNGSYNEDKDLFSISDNEEEDEEELLPQPKIRRALKGKGKKGWPPKSVPKSRKVLPLQIADEDFNTKF